MDFPLPLTLVLMMTEDADRYAAREAESAASSSREIVAAPRSSGKFPTAAQSDRFVGESSQHVA